MDHNQSVAIVDDERELVKTYTMLLMRRNIPIAFCACDGDDAIAQFKSANPRPRVVILDYRLGPVTGLDVLRAMLAEEPGTKVIFISGDGEVREKSLAAGAKLFIKKPAGIKEISEAVKAMMES